MGVLLSEELQRISYLMNHKRGVVISEQAAPGGLKGNYDESKKEYTVFKGDTLSKIGKAFGIKWMDIWEKNKGTLRSGQPNCGKYCGYNWIFVGEKLIIPTESKPAETKTVPEYAIVSGSTVQFVFDKLATDADKMNNQPFYTFCYFVKSVPNPDPVLPLFNNILVVDGVASALKTEDFKTKYPNFAKYQFVTTPEGGFKAGMDVETGAIYKTETKPSSEDKTNSATQDTNTQTQQTNTQTQDTNTQTQQTNTQTQEAGTQDFENQEFIDNWCDTNEILADEDCYPVEKLTYDQARRQASINATKAKHPYKRDEYWDEARQLFIAIYGFRSRSKKELSRRKENKSSEQAPQAQPEQDLNKPSRGVEVDANPLAAPENSTT